MLTKEQLDVIKERVSRFNEEKSSVVEAEIAIAITEYDVPALIAEVERLQRFESAYCEERQENVRLRKALDEVLHKSSEALEKPVEKTAIIDIRKMALSALIGEQHE